MCSSCLSSALAVPRPLSTYCPTFTILCVNPGTFNSYQCSLVCAHVPFVEASAPFGCKTSVALKWVTLGLRVGSRVGSWYNSSLMFSMYPLYEMCVGCACMAQSTWKGWLVIVVLIRVHNSVYCEVRDLAFNWRWELVLCSGVMRCEQTPRNPLVSINLFLAWHYEPK
jgi:hypothetical protein